MNAHVTDYFTKAFGGQSEDEALNTLIGAIVVDTVRLALTISITIVLLDGFLAFIAALAMWLASNWVFTRTAAGRSVHAAASRTTGRAVGFVRGLFAK